jgi:hypothetical protein
MSQEESKDAHVARGEHKPYRVRLPGFVSDQDVGLGDIIKRATSTARIMPCGGCEQRAATLNRWFVFSGRRTK